MPRAKPTESVTDIIQKARAPAVARPARAAAPAKPQKSTREKQLEQELAESRARLAALENSAAAPAGSAYEVGDRGETIDVAAPLRRTVTRPPREAPRDAAREPSRPGAVMVQGRDGEVLTRRRVSVGDIFDVPKHEIPRGWEYQWNIMTVTGEEKLDVQLEMQANGWRPVPASRHPGRWTQDGFEGAIVVRGLRLEERPAALSQEAREEDTARARAQVRDQTDALRLSKKGLADGMAIGQKYRGTGAEVRMSIDPALDIPRPAHQLEGE